jgi:hypothetical protein
MHVCHSRIEEAGDVMAFVRLATASGVFLWLALWDANQYRNYGDALTTTWVLNDLLYKHHYKFVGLRLRR